MRLSRSILALLSCLVFLESLCLAKSDQWIEVRSHNFIVVSNAGEKQARRAALHFEQIRAVFRQSLAAASKHSSPTVIAFVVTDEDSMRELLPEDWAKGHAHPAGYFASLLNQYYAAVRLDAPVTNPYATFYHEYYHTISVPYVPDLPLWLAEGLAEFYGHTRIEDKYVVMGEADPALLQVLRAHPLIPLATLFQINRTSPYYNETEKTSIFYAESWALAHYLLVGDHAAHRPLLTRYLGALDQSKQWAIEELGNLNNLQLDLENYLHNSRFSQLKLPAPQLTDIETKVRPLSQAEVYAYRGGFFAVRNRTGEAAAILHEALRLDPHLALAYQNLGITEYVAGERDQAQQSMTEAIALDPRNPFTRYMRAYLAASGSDTLHINSQMEEDLRQAIALDSNFEPSYGLLAMYLATIDKDLDEARSFAQHAVTSEPANSTYQLDLAQALLRMNKFDEAAALAARAQALAKNPTEKANAENFASYLQTVRDYHSHKSDDELDNAEAPSPNSTNGETSTMKSVADSAPSGAGKGLPSSSAASAVQMQTTINILSDTSGFDFTSYLREVIDSLRNQLAAKPPDKITAQRSLSLEFSVLKSGKISALKVFSSSGDVALDRATQDSVSATSLPSLPRAFPGQYLRLHFGVAYVPVSSN